MQVLLTNDNFTENYLNNLLLARGIEDVEEYLHPTTQCVQDPGNLKNISTGAALYLRVVMNDKPPYSKILIVVDCDCDGYTSAAIIYQYTKRLNCHCQIDYVLHEGKQHGLEDHIDRLMDSDTHYDLVICPDAATNDKEFQDQLSTINTPCLVIDHHLQEASSSINAIIVNNQISPKYLNKDLTGAGVVWQFCRYIDQKVGHNWADEYLDLAALGIIGDMGSMLSMENRYVSTVGLDERHLSNSFFRCLLEKQSYSITGKQGASWMEVIKATNAMSVAFYIVPLINGLIRVGAMEEKERMFLAFIDGGRMVPTGKRGAKGMLERVDIESARECGNAKNKQNRIKETAVECLEEKIFKYDLLENKILFIRLDEDDDFLPSELNGLVANQLAEKYKRPTIIARLNDAGYMRGSIRGLNQSSLSNFKQFLVDSKLFEYVQGHANAAGCSILSTNINELLNYANTELAEVDFGENFYHVCFSRHAKDADLNRLVSALGAANDIWGQSNPPPLIHIHDIPVAPSCVRVMGANQDTVKIEAGGLNYLKFHAKALIEKLTQTNQPFTLEVVGRPNLNEWMGRVTPQIIVEDYEIKTQQNELMF